ncbi:MAG: cobyric acid synthase [Chloroflexi bacterium]|nr:cobyric acid synthase [Chloroflexota bacterium]
MAPAKTIMVQGTASSVGKSILVTALCRIFKQDGYRVAPFKSQNMSLNSFVTRDGGEFGRAQAVQAEAAGVESSVDMNPILLKPETDAMSQVIVRGKLWKTLHAGEYWRDTQGLIEVVQGSLDRLRHDYEIVVIEGAGSPAEINLREHEIVNMRVARMAQAPVLLVGDIDRGGVFASLVGTLELLTPEERGFVKGLVINKFRGDPSLLRPGLEMLAERSGKPCLGIIPYITDLGIAQEDSVFLEERPAPGHTEASVDIAVMWLPHMSNYDDFDPLERRGCSLRYVSSVSELGVPDLIILPGTKTTIADMMHLRRNGLARALVQLNRRGTPIVGICGGFQMLGRSLRDPDGIESSRREVEGFGLLDADTVFYGDKQTIQVKGKVATGRGLLSGLRDETIEGYEIHMGRTERLSGDAVFTVWRNSGDTPCEDGCLDSSGTVMGTYLHGIFNNEGFTSRLLAGLARGAEIARRDTREWRQKEYDRLAITVRHNLAMDKVYEMLG